jgi:hypothetical protein
VAQPADLRGQGHAGGEGKEQAGIGSEIEDHAPGMARNSLTWG